MKNTIYSIITVLFLSCQSHAKTIVLPVGKAINVSTSSTRKVSISNSKVIKWTDHGSHLRVYAISEGVSEIKSGTKISKVIILTDSKYKFYEQVQKWLSDKIGLYIHINKNQVYISGHLHRFSDWLDLAKISKNLDANYIFNANIDKEVLTESKKYFTEKLSNFHHLSAQLELAPRITLSRIVKDNVKSLDSIFKNYGFKIINLKKSNQQVLLNLYYLEINHSKQKQYGIMWSENFTAQFIPKFIDQSFLAGAISNEMNEGDFHIINKSQIICLENQSCELNEGGEIPIKSKSFTSSRVSWKSYGINLKFKPSLTVNSNINLDFQYSISHPDHSQSIDNIPGIKTKKISTNFTSANNKLILISGLSLNSSGSNSNQPWLTHAIPLFKYIFKNKSNKESSSNLYLLIKTQIINKESI